MRNLSRKEQRRKQKFLTIAVLAAAAVVAGGFFLWSQLPEKNEPTAVSVDEDDLGQTDTDTIEYDGSVYSYNDHLSNYLFMGIDTREDVSTYEKQNDAGQADAIFLVSIDRVTKKMNTLAIPRDTMAEIEVFNPSGKSLGKTKDHINIQYAYGNGREKSCELMKEAVSRLLGDIPIQKYCSLNMDGIPFLTEAVDGVTVTVPDSSLEEIDPSFYEGAVVELTGENTEMFVRHRDTAQSGSAMVRQGRQKVFMKAFMEKAREKATQDASFILELYEKLEPYMVTNMGNDLFAELLASSEGVSAETNVIPGEAVSGDFDEYHVDQDALTGLLVEMFYEKEE